MTGQGNLAGEQVDGTTLPHRNHVALAPPNMVGVEHKGISDKSQFTDYAHTQKPPIDAYCYGDNTSTLMTFTPEQFNEIMTKTSYNNVSSRESSEGTEHHLKGGKLPHFHHTPTTTTGLDVDDWLRMAEDCMKLERVRPQDMVLWTTTHLGGSAATWWRGVRAKKETWTWEEFVYAITSAFVSPIRAMKAQDEIRTIKQGNRSLGAYVAHFRNLEAKLTDMSDADKIANFLEGLARADLREFIGLEMMRGVWTYQNIISMTEYYGSAEKFRGGSSQRGRGNYISQRGRRPLGRGGLPG